MPDEADTSHKIVFPKPWTLTPDFQGGRHTLHVQSESARRMTLSQARKFDTPNSPTCVRKPQQKRMNADPPADHIVSHACLTANGVLPGLRCATAGIPLKDYMRISKLIARAVAKFEQAFSMWFRASMY